MRAVQRQSLGGNRSAVASKNRCVSHMDGGGISLLFPVLAAIFAVQPGHRGQSATDAPCQLDRRPARPDCRHTEGEYVRHCRPAPAGAGRHLRDPLLSHGIGTALDDLEAGRIGLVIKLFPVISWLTRERPELAIAMQIPTHEQLGIAYAQERADLSDAVDATIEALRESGEFAKLQAAWPGTGAAV